MPATTAPSTTAATARTRARAAAAARRRSPCTRRRCAGPSACAGRGARRSPRSCCSASSRSRRSSTSASATSPATSRVDRIEIITYREYVGVSSALLLFVALVAPDVDVPRPPPARAAADVRPAADRRRLRHRQGRGDRARSCSPSRSSPRSCCSSATCSSATARSTTSRGHLDVLWKVPVAVAPARRLLRRRSASRSPRSPTAGSSPARRSSACSSSRRSPRGSSSATTSSATDGSPAALINVLGLPLYLRDLVFLGHVDRELAAERRRQRRRCWRSSLYVVVVARRRRRAAAALPLGGAVIDAPTTAAELRAPTTRRSPPTPPSRSTDVSVWFGPKVALSELSCSFGPGVTGLLGPNGAGKTTLMRAITGLVGVNQGTVRVDGPRPAPRPRASTRGWRSCPRTRRCRPGSPPASSSATSPTSTASPTAARPTRRCATVGLLDVADRRVDGFSKGMRQRTQDRRRAGAATRRCSCSTSR